MEIKAKFDEFKETVKQKADWAKGHKKEVAKIVVVTLWNVGTAIVGAYFLNQNNTLKKDNHSLVTTNQALTNTNTKLNNQLVQTMQELNDCKQAVGFLQAEKIKTQAAFSRLAAVGTRHGSSDCGRALNSLKGKY